MKRLLPVKYEQVCFSHQRLRLSSVFPSRSSVRPHLRFLTSPLSIGRTVKAFKQVFFQTIDAFITSFYDRSLILEWLLMANPAVSTAS